MENFENLVEKYKREMMDISSRSAFEAEEEESETSENTEITQENTQTAQMPEKTDLPEMNTGFLKVSVFAGNEAFPVETARVEVFDKNGNMLYSLLTNSGGIAEGMVLPAPSEKENDEPGGVDGFTRYRVRVSHPDYQTQTFDGVQIFEGIESIQPVFLQVAEFSENGGEYNA